MKSYKFSKAYTAVFMYRFAFILLLPFIEGLLFSNASGYTLITLYSADLTGAVLLLWIAVIRCESSQLTVNGRKITVSKGIILKASQNTALDGEGVLSIGAGLMLRLLKGSRLRMFSGNACATAYLKTADSREIARKLINGKELLRFKSNALRSLLMSASFSNSLTGLLAAIPILRRVSAVLSTSYAPDSLSYDKAGDLLLALKARSGAFELGALLFLFWFIGCFTEFLREYGLTFRVYPDFFSVSKGLMTKTLTVFYRTSVRAMVFRQSLPMRALRLFSAELFLSVKPERKLHILSAAKKTAGLAVQRELFGENGEPKIIIKPPKKALWGYGYLPYICTSLLCGAIIGFSDYLLLRMILTVLSAVAAVWFLFRFFALRHCALYVYADAAEVKGYSKMNFTQWVFKKENTVSVSVSQSIFQRLSGRCSLSFAVEGSYKLKIGIKHINKKELTAALSFWDIKL